MNDAGTTGSYPAPPPTPPRPKRPSNWLGWLSLLLSSAALAAAGFALFLSWPEAPAPQPELPTPGSYITFAGRELPVQENVPVNTLEASCLSTDEMGWLTYEKDGVKAIPGIDVSAYQGEIDWTAVASSGVRFAIVRVGYRGYGAEGKLLLDSRWQENLEGALAAGLDVGVYFFSQATSIWEVEEELELLLNTIEGYELTYPVVFDWELMPASRNARTQGLSGESISRMADFFCHQVTEAGYTPAVYFNQHLAYLYLDLDRLKDNSFWLAEYNSAPGFYYGFDLWQYSDKASVPGIAGDVDMNLSFRDFSAPAQP